MTDLVPGYAHPYSRGPYLTTNATKDTDDCILLPRSSMRTNSTAACALGRAYLTIDTDPSTPSP